MRIRCAGLRAFSLPLVKPLATAHGPITRREGWLVALMDEAGRVGLGEATPLPAFGTEEGICAQRALERMAEGIVDREACEDRSLESILRSVVRRMPGSHPSATTPCAIGAMQAALCDLAAQRTGRSLASWLRDRSGASGGPLPRLRIQALVGGADPRQVEGAARKARVQGFSVFKLKLGISRTRRSLGADLERVAALRSEIGPSARIRLDANEAWSRHEAESALARLAAFDVDYVEQPVHRFDLSGLKALDEADVIPVAADEALLRGGWQACLETRAARIFILKPAALGGPLDVLELVRRARGEGIRIVWSNLIEGVVGRSVAVALAAATATREEVHGLGTAGLLAGDLGEGARTRSGSIEVATVPGLGCRLPSPWQAATVAAPDAAVTPEAGDRIVSWGPVRIFGTPS